MRPQLNAITAQAELNKVANANKVEQIKNFFKTSPGDYDENDKSKIYRYYIKNVKYINNWDLVDSSAQYIMGNHLMHKNKKDLLNFALSENIWKRRIAMMSTFYFIKSNDYKFSLKLAKMFIKDDNDLIHKATGWMLREIAKRKLLVATRFLDKHAHLMPRTMLRYAIEKLPKKKREFYLNKKSEG